MRPDKAEELMKVYPELFHGQCIGFECGDGWFDIIKELISDIRNVCERDVLDIKATQIKEKCGSLRFYVTHETNEISDLITLAEDKSESICELCGDVGDLQVNGRYVRVICDECNK